MLQSANHRDHPYTFDKSWGLNMLLSANHRDYPYTFEKLGTKFKILVNTTTMCVFYSNYCCTVVIFMNWTNWSCICHMCKIKTIVILLCREMIC
ncbi:hypothetical protein Hanom_Chr02g00171661 [Helianthus anomalus]